MDKEYKIAISYSHMDMKIAELIQSEVKNIFAERYFMDSRRPEELADASAFKRKLQNIFRSSDYSLVLYSKNYKNGTFTSVEWETIQDKAYQEKPPHLFIINLNDCELPESTLDEYTYISLNIPNTENDELEIDTTIRKKIHDIIHDSIKNAMICHSIAEKKQEEQYSLNVHTTFDSSNRAKWEMNYDWNLIGSAYVEGRTIKKEYSWQNLWEYVEKDFLYIKDKLMKKDNIQLKIHFNCHLSIAYKLGTVYGDLGRASGNRNLILESSNHIKNISFSLNPEIDYQPVEDFCDIREGNNNESTDIICIISIKPNANDRILSTVRTFLEERKYEYCRICLFIKNETINDSLTLESIAEYIREKINSCRPESRYRIHLFPDTTAPLMFVLGARTIVPGRIQMYEYVREKDSYEMSLMR